MQFKEFQSNVHKLNKLFEEMQNHADPKVNEFIKQYIEQNMLVMNEIFSASIEHLQHIQNVKNVNEVICAQAKFTNDITQKLTLSAQRFLNTSLGQIADYNDWLKAHCDMATD